MGRDFHLYFFRLLFTCLSFKTRNKCSFISSSFQAVYGTLFEAEHRSTFYIPYWKFPPARWLVPRQRKFANDLKIINDCLDGLIKNAKETRQVNNHIRRNEKRQAHVVIGMLLKFANVHWQEMDVEKLQERDYSNLKVCNMFHLIIDDAL